MKKFDLTLGIISIVGFFVLRFSRVFRWEWNSLQATPRTVAEIVLGLGMPGGGGFMLSLWSR